MDDIRHALRKAAKPSGRATLKLYLPKAFLAGFVSNRMNVRTASMPGFSRNQLRVTR